MARWLQHWTDLSPDRPLLVCAPQAGAASGQFRRWQEGLGDDAHICGVQLPGREGRWNEPPPPDVAHVVSRVTGEILAVRSDLPVVVFGDSFGGLLAFEITAALRRASRDVSSLVIAACRPPEIWAGQGVADDEENLRALMDSRDLTRDLDPEVRELVLGVLRKDIALSKTYTGPPSGPVDVPLQGWAGLGDPVLGPQEMEGWADSTTRDYLQREFPGGHHFVFDDPDTVLPLLRELVVEARTATAGTPR
jgi:surfactin synthase thioesterase subunit